MYRQAIKAKQQFSIKSNQNREIRIKKRSKPGKRIYIKFLQRIYVSESKAKAGPGNRISVRLPFRISSPKGPTSERQSFPCRIYVSAYIPNQSSSSWGINAAAMIVFVSGHHRLHWHSAKAANCNRKLDCNSIIFGVKAKQINKPWTAGPGIIPAHMRRPGPGPPFSCNFYD